MSRHPALALSKVEETLANPFYIGVVGWKGARYPGQHKARVSGTLFGRVQTATALARLDQAVAHKGAIDRRT